MGAIQLGEVAPRPLADAAERSGRPWVRSHRSLVSLGVIQTVVVAWVLRAGQPLNVDTLNSHIYVLWSLTHHQQDFAWGPGGPGSYLPTTWNVPWWLLTNHAPGPVVAVYLGVVAGSSVWLVWLLGRDLATRLGVGSPEVVAWFAAGIAFLSAMFHAELGTTFGDVATAPLVLLSVWLVVRAPRRASAVLLAGLTTGAAFGLKLTNGPYVLGLLALVLVMCRPRWRAAGVCAAGSVVGAVVSGGWWWLKMFHRFGNPLFPFFGGVIPSDYGVDGNVGDHRWPLGPSALLSMPWRMAVHGYPTEVPLRDARWLALVVLLAAWLVRRSRDGEGLARRAPLVSPLIGVVAYAIVAFMSWGFAFGYGRYLLAGDLVVSAILAVLVWQLAARTRAHQLLGTLTLVLILLVVVDLQAPYVVGWSDRWSRVALPPVASQRDEVLVLPGNDGLSYVVASAPADARIVQAPSVFSVLSDAAPGATRLTGREDQQIRVLIEGHRGPVVALMSPDDLGRGADVAQSYGMIELDAQCERFRVNIAHLTADELHIKGVGDAGAPAVAYLGRDALACPWVRR